MEKRNKEYIEGYKDCAKNFEHYLNQTMRRHGGVVTHAQAWNVVSEIAHYLHVQRLQILGLEQQIQPQPSTQTTIYMIVDTENIH